MISNTGKSLNILFSKEMYEKLKSDAAKCGIGVGSYVKTIIAEWYKLKGE